MLTDDFDFELPRDLIAQHPVTPRDASRLLVVGRRLEDRAFRDLPGLLRPGDTLVFNDTKVIPTRLAGRRGEARVEVTLHNPEGDGRWRAFARPGKRLRPGDRIDFAESFAAEVMEKVEGGEVVLAFGLAGRALMAALERHGAMPLPPYIRREAGPEDRDRADYQTIFARREGAVAAPTASLHFTERVLTDLEARGIGRVFVTLHVGAGTFLPVKTERAEDHVMHAEWGEVTGEAVDTIERARAEGGRVVAVGSTALRLLEAAAGPEGHLKPFSGETDLFILPGYRFRVAELMLTNFHLPRSTLFMLVAAFAGTARMKAAYAHAVAARYRFFSYGDACLLTREDLL